MKSSHIILCGLGVLALAGCSHHDGWGVKGNIEGADKGTKLAIEANNAGHWYVLDSVEVASDGKFEYNAPEPYTGQDILRLTLPGKGSVYFPIDSIDQVTVTATADNFGSKHTVSGTPLAWGINRVDSIVNSTADPEALRRGLVNVITTDTTGIVAYYALGKSLGGKLLFDPNENFGNRAYGAVAQLYAMHRPNDPRANAVRQSYIDGRRALGKITQEAQQVFEIPETGFFEIERYDARGQKQSLTQLAQGKAVILNFTSYELQGSPAINAMLNEIYTKHHSQGLEIYQLAFDSDEVSWREAARNLPWTAVWNAPSDGSMVLVNYNVGTMPLFYIINKQGELVERVETPSELPTKITKYL